MGANQTLVDVVDTEAEAQRLTVPPLIILDHLDAVLPGSGPIELERCGAGHSNATFRVRRGEDEWILRRPPRPPYEARAHDVMREYRFLVALQDEKVPTPMPVMACEDGRYLGAPFYLMESVRGHVIRDSLPPELEAPGSRERVAAELVDSLISLHAVEWRGGGFPVRGTGEEYLVRQLDLWSAQWENVCNREVPEVSEVGERLRATLPVSGAPSVVHGDFKLDNLIFADHAPPRVAAVLDWEMATIGDPLADVGFLAATWIDPDEGPDRLLGISRATAEPGFPSRSWLIDRYADRSGRDPTGIIWYEAFALWKLAVLLEGSYRRYQDGTTDDPFFALLTDGVPSLASDAVELLADCQR